MNREQFLAKIRAAAWAAAAELGSNEAQRLLAQVREELSREQWNDPHGGDR